MKKVFVTIIVSFLLSHQSIWAISIDSIFVKLQIPELSFLSTNNKLDLLDYYNCGQVANVENVCSGRTILASKTTNCLQLEMTTVSRVELMVLPCLQSDSIVGVISTIKEPIEVSQLRFYTLDGTPLSVNYQLPSVDDFFENDLLRVKSNNLMPKIQVKATYLSEEKVLNCELSLKCLTLEEQKEISLPLRPLCYKWDGMTFVKE